MIVESVMMQRLRRLVALPVVAFVTCVAVVWGPGTPAAQAFNPGYVTIGAGLSTAVGESLAISGGAVAVGAIGLGVLGLGVAAYATRDSWMPVVTDLVNGDWLTDATGSGSASCSGVAHPQFDPGDARTLQVLVTLPAGCSQAGKWTVRGTCKVSTGGYTTVSGLNLATSTVYPGENLRGIHVCGAGQELMYAYGQDVFGNYGDIELGTAIPAEEWTSTTTVKCKSADGTETTISDSETGHPDRIAVPSCADRVPGSIPWEVTVTGGPDGGTGREVAHMTTTQDVFEDYGDCFTELGLVCQVKVYVDGQACTVGASDCGQWATLAVNHPERVKCQLGHYVVGLSNCDPLKNAYKAGAQPQEVTDPNVWPGAASDPGTDPETGGSTFPESGTNPESAPTTNPSVDPDSNNCWGQGWSWNPISWVYVPVKCALKWAFVPSPGYLDAKIDGIRAAWDGTTPGKYVAAVGGLVPNVPGYSDCSGIPVHVDLGIGETTAVDFRLGAACAGDTLHAAAGIVKIVMSAVVLVATVWQCVRLVVGSVYPAATVAGTGNGGAAT